MRETRVLAILFAVTAACANDEASNRSSELLEVSHGADALRGRSLAELVPISFASQTHEPGRYSVTLEIGDKVVGFDVDDNASRLELAGSNVVLTVDDRMALRALANELGGFLGADAPRHAALVVIAAEYLMASPDLEPIGTRSIVSGKGVSYGDGNNGITCVPRGGSYRTYYDNGGGGWYQTVTVGSNWGTNNCGWGDYSCMGRCGGGCGGIGGGWTLDCLEHDLCSHNGWNGVCGNDGGCGDEWNDAEDDFWWNNCPG